MMESGYGVASSTVICVYLFGPLDVSRRGPDGEWQAVKKKEWDEGTPPRSVLKRLLTAPGRHLSRVDIADDLWPTAGMQLADRNLSTGLMVIRRIIGKELVSTIGPLCTIVGQSQVWTDLDACYALLREAENHGCTTADALPFLEEMHQYLERGRCLEDEGETWCHAVRTDAECMGKQCRMWLAEGYELAGKLWQAGEIYRAMMRTLPPDEEALQRWITMLTRAGRWQEALHCHEHIQERCTALGYPLALSAPNNPARNGYILGPVTLEDTQMRSVLRRQLLRGIMALPFALLVPEPAITDAEAYLAQCQEQIGACWRLLDGKDIRSAQFLLYSWLPPLEQLLSNSSVHQRKAAHLAAQGYLLAGLVAILGRQNDAAEWCRRQAVEYAELSGDISLKVAALKHLATHYDDLHCLLATRNTYEKALPFLADATPLLRSRIELGLALSEARLGRKPEALHYWDLAQEHFPTYPEEQDPAFAFADCGKASFNHYGGLMYLEFGQPEQAWTLFDGTIRTPVPERTSNEITLCQVQATLQMHDLDRTITHLQDGIQGAIRLQSEMRLHDSQALYQQACALWPNERAVKRLEALFH